MRSGVWGIGDEWLFLPWSSQTDPSFQMRPYATRHQTVCVHVCACVCTLEASPSVNRTVKCLRTDSRAHRGRVLWEGAAGLVVLEQGEKVVVAVGGEVRGVEVRQ